jgi:hypothetical protein
MAFITEHSLWVILFGSLLIEFFTVVMRLVYHHRSARIQHALHMPRIHHSYIGFLLLGGWALWHHTVLLIIGTALVISDGLHHFIFLPLATFLNFDIRMHYHAAIHRVLRWFTGIILIAIGIFALLTPFTPGSWLIPIGMIFCVGKNKTNAILQRLLGTTLYKRLRIERIVHAFIK